VGLVAGVQTRHTIGWLLGLVPAGILFAAAILKAFDPSLFAMQITAHKVTPAVWSMPLAYFFIAVELLLGIALLLRLLPRWTHLGFIALMVGFIVVTAIAWSHGNTKECGCFGRSVGQGPLTVIIRDVVLIAISLVSVWLLRDAKTPRYSHLLAAVLIPLAFLFTAFGAKMPADSFVTGLHAGADLGDLPIEDLRKPHTEGRVLLVLIEEDCKECIQAVPQLGEIARQWKEQIRVAAVYSGTRKDATTWRMKQLPAFPVAHASPRALRAYYRRLPVAFLSNDGRLIHAFWDRLPTAEDLEPFVEKPESERIGD
jgi:hypothetical protein